MKLWHKYEFAVDLVTQVLSVVCLRRWYVWSEGMRQAFLGVKLLLSMNFRSEGDCHHRILKTIIIITVSTDHYVL